MALHRNITACRTGRAALAFALMAGGFTGVAQAQDAAVPAAGIADIVVTASRREVSVQKESRAIDVVSGASLVRNGVTDATTLQKLVPGLSIAQNGSLLQVSVRGVGDRAISASTDPAVAMSIDGVYLPRANELTKFFFDIDRVELLKGPQGTLYGRNASAGALNVITIRPKFETSGYIEGEYGNYDAKRLAGAINYAIGDSVAVRIAGQWTDRDGYLTDGFNDDKSHAVRAQMLIAPTSDTSLLIEAAYSHTGGLGSAGVLSRGTLSRGAAPALPDNRWAGPTDPSTLAYLDATSPGAARALRLYGDTAHLRLNVYTLSATFEHKFDWATLTLIPSYVGARLNEINYASLAVASQEVNKSDEFAMEARLSSPSDARIKWVIGSFGSLEDISDMRQSYIPILPTNAIDSVSVTPVLNDRTWAVFGEANASLTDRLRLIAGGRYTWEKKYVRGYIGTVGLTFDPSIPGLVNPSDFPLTHADADYPTTGPSVDGQRVDKAFNYRAGIEYDLAPRSMVYATVSTGFKAGGFFGYLSPYNSYKPEKLTSFQVGSKNRFLDNRLQFNVEGFYWKYKNKQETFLANFGPPYGNILDTANAGRVTMYGADVSIIGQITPNDTISGEAEYLHSKYDRFTYSFVGSPDPTINCPAATDTAGVTTVDCSGNMLIRAPKWTGRATYTHAQSLGDDLGKLVFEGGMRFSSSYWFANNFTALVRQRSYQAFDASLTWELPISRFAVTGFVRNIANRVIYTQGVASASIAGASAAAIEPPRTYGVRLRASF